jgi:tripartite-type tricarboxylate transporter receptor subunit TctC
VYRHARGAARGARVLAQPETRDKLQSVGVELFEDNQANFRGFFVAEIEKWRKVVKAANLKLE